MLAEPALGSCSVVAILPFFLSFEQGALHFHFAFETCQLCSWSCLLSQDISLRDSDLARSECCQGFSSPERAWGLAKTLLADPGVWGQD